MVSSVSTNIAELMQSTHNVPRPASHLLIAEDTRLVQGKKNATKENVLPSIPAPAPLSVKKMATATHATKQKPLSVTLEMNATKQKNRVKPQVAR
jgi:hypothetical protein